MDGKFGIFHYGKFFGGKEIPRTWVSDLYDHCAEGSCRFSSRNGRSRHDRGLGHARFPFWGYGKAPPSFCTVGKYNHCAAGSCRFSPRNGRSRHDRGLGHARSSFWGMGSLPLPSIQWESTTTVRRGHAGFLPEMGGAGMIGDWDMPVSPSGGMGSLPLPSALWVMITPPCGGVMPVSSQKWGKSAWSGIGTCPFPLLGVWEVSPFPLHTKGPIHDLVCIRNTARHGSVLLKPRPVEKPVYIRFRVLATRRPTGWGEINVGHQYLGEKNPGYWCFTVRRGHAQIFQKLECQRFWVTHKNPNYLI